MGLNLIDLRFGQQFVDKVGLYKTLLVVIKEYGDEQVVLQREDMLKLDEVNLLLYITIHIH